MEIKRTLFIAGFGLIALVGVVVLSVVTLNASLLSRTIHIIYTDNQTTTPPPETTLVFVGDIMLSRSVAIKTVQHDDWRWPFLLMGDYLREADILFGNLEGPISDEGRNVGSKYSFRANPHMVEGLIYAGFDVVSVANNHIGDWTQEAISDTFELLKSSRIAYAGGGLSEKEAHAPKIIERNGVRFGFLAYSDLGPRATTEAVNENAGIAWLEKERMIQDIKNARGQADVVIVSVHMGEEYSTNANEKQRDIAHSAIDAGATFFIGHHPHVVQEVERYNDGFIAYSLGNFVFDQDFSQETMQGLLLRATVREGKITNIEEIEVNISNDFQPSVNTNFSSFYEERHVVSTGV